MSQCSNIQYDFYLTNEKFTLRKLDDFFLYSLCFIVDCRSSFVIPLKVEPKQNQNGTNVCIKFFVFLSKTFRMQRIILSTHTHSTCYKPRNNSHRKSMHVTRIAWHKQNDKSPKMEEEEENKIIFLSVSMCFTTFSFSHLPCWMDMAVFFFLSSFISLDLIPFFFRFVNENERQREKRHMCVTTITTFT